MNIIFLIKTSDMTLKLHFSIVNLPPSLCWRHFPLQSVTASHCLAVTEILLTLVNFVDNFSSYGKIRKTPFCGALFFMKINVFVSNVKVKEYSYCFLRSPFCYVCLHMSVTLNGKDNSLFYFTFKVKVSE